MASSEQGLLRRDLNRKLVQVGPDWGADWGAVHGNAHFSEQGVFDMIPMSGKDFIWFDLRRNGLFNKRNNCHIEYHMEVS